MTKGYRSIGAGQLPTHRSKHRSCRSSRTRRLMKAILESVTRAHTSQGSEVLYCRYAAAWQLPRQLQCLQAGVVNNKTFGSPTSVPADEMRRPTQHFSARQCRQPWNAQTPRGPTRMVLTAAPLPAIDRRPVATRALFCCAHAVL
jgi:hypothetical protein